MHRLKEYDSASWDCVIKLMNFNNQKFSKKTDFSVTGTIPVIERLVELKPDCFRLDTRELKKSGNLNILLADWQLYYGGKDLEKLYHSYQQLLRVLTEQQFQVYVFQGKILRPVTTETDLLSCSDTPMCFSQANEINTQLALLGHDASQFFIINHYQMFQLMELVKTISTHGIKENKIASTSELAKLKYQALEESDYTLSLSLDLDDHTFLQILNSSQHLEIEIIEFLLPQVDSSLVDINQKMLKMFEKLDRFYGKNKKPPGLRIDLMLFREFMDGREHVFKVLIDNCLACYKPGELRKLHLFNYRGTLDLSQHLQIEELLITPEFSINNSQANIFTTSSATPDRDEKQKIINIKALKSLRRYEYHADKETISNAHFFSEDKLTEYEYAVEFDQSIPLKTLCLPTLPQDSKKIVAKKNNLSHFKNLEFLHIDGSLLQGMDDFSLTKLKSITINLVGLDEEEQDKFLLSLQKTPCLTYINLLKFRGNRLDLSRFTQLKTLACVLAVCQIILPVGLEELNLFGVKLPSPLKLKELKVLNLSNMDLANIDIKETTQTLTLLRIERCTNIDKILNYSFPHLLSLIIDNKLVKPLSLDHYPVLQQLNITGDFILDSKKNSLITSANLKLTQFLQIEDPWIFHLKSLTLKMNEFCDDIVDLRAFTQITTLQFDMLKVCLNKVYLPPNLKYLNIKSLYGYPLGTLIDYLSTVLTNLADLFLIRKSIIVTAMEKEKLYSSVLLTSDSLQKLLKAKKNVDGIPKLIKETVDPDSKNERKQSSMNAHMMMNSYNSIFGDKERKFGDKKEINHSSKEKGKKLIDNFSATSKFDDNTKANPNDSHKGNIFIYQKNPTESEPLSPIETGEYRFQVMAAGKTDDLTSQLIEPSKSDLVELNKDYKEFKWCSQEIIAADFQKNSAEHDYYGYILPEKLFSAYSDHAQQTNGWIPLTMLTAQDRLSSIYLPADAKLRYNCVNQQYEVFLPTYVLRNAHPKAITYVFSTEDKPPFPVISRPIPKFVDSLVSILDQIFSLPHTEKLLPTKFSTFLMLFNSEKNPTERLAILIDYFSDKFYSDDLMDNPPYLKLLKIIPSSRIWVQSLIESKGACRHRAKLFYLIASHVLKLSVRIVTHGAHEDIEYEDNGVFKRIDLKGFPFKSLPSEVSLPSKKAEKTIEKEQKTTDSLTPLTIQTRDEIEPEINDDPAILLFLSELQAGVDDCESWSELTAMLQTTQRLLLRTNDNEETRRIALGLQTELAEAKSQYDYIETAEELEYALSSLHIDEEANTHKLPGPLVKLISPPSLGVKPVSKCLLINWNNFTAEQMNRFKSMLDDPPMVSGLPVDPQLKIINLLNADVNVSELFTSRCDEEIFWPTGKLELPPLPNEFQFIPQDSKALSMESKEPAKKVTVNLFHGGLPWREALIGQILLINGKPSFVPGVLTQAVLTGAQNIVIQNSPTHAQDGKEHAELMGFLMHLQITGYFVANGVGYDLRRGLKITPDGKSAPLEIQSEFKISLEESPPMQLRGELNQQELISKVKNPGSSKIFIMNDSNYSTFFRQVKVDDEGNLINQPGWIEDCATKDLILFAEDLSPGKRERALIECRQKIKIINWGDALQVQDQLHRSWLPDEKNPAKPGAYLIQTTDVDFTVAGLRQELAKQKSPAWHMTPVHSNMRFGELMARILVPAVAEENQPRWGKYAFNRKVQYQQTPLLEALVAGEDVFVQGSLGIDCYDELASLRATPPYLQLNGQRVEVKGRLFLVTPPLAYETAGGKHTPTWKEYEAALKAEFETEFKHTGSQLSGIIACLGQLYEFAEGLEYGKPGMPPRLLWNYHRLSQCVKILLNIKNSKDEPIDDNPLKNILLFDYDPFSEEYAFLNSMAKLLFGPKKPPDLRQEKMAKFNKLGEDAYWRQWNCYNGPALRQIFGRKPLKDLLGTQKSHGLPKLLAPPKKVFSFPPTLIKKPEITPEISNKHLRKVLGFLKQNPFAFLKGLPGTGKSFTSEILDQGEVKGFGKVKTFWGETQIESWITAKDSDYFILFIDEANLNNPQDYWNFLKDLRQQPPSIHWQGRRILLSSQHKVIFTGNPEHYSRQRDFHNFLEEMPIDFYKDWSPEKIVEHLSKLWLEIKSQIQPEEKKEEKTTSVDKEITVIQLIVKAMQKLKETFPTLFPPGRLTLRDLHQLVHRLGIRRHLPLDFKNLAYSACIDEWLPLLPTHEQRDAFRQELNKLFSIEKYPADIDEKLLTNNPDWENIRKLLHIPQGRWHDVLVMFEDLKLQAKYSSTGSNHRIKNAILLEGPSGIGKTTLLVGMLQTLGYRKLTPKELTDAFNQAKSDSKDIKLSPKTFIHLTAGDAHNAELLTQAFMLGIPVVFDEIDLQPLPELLNHLLTGSTADKVKPYRPGFFLMASQNSGRTKLPLDFENRFRKIYLQAYSDTELHEIASQALTKAEMEFKPQEVTEFVDKFSRARILRNGKMNARNFFRTLKKVISKSPQERSFMKCWQSVIDERQEWLLTKGKTKTRELIPDQDKTGLITPTPVEELENKQEVSIASSLESAQPVRERVNSAILPVTQFLAELIELKFDSQQTFKKLQHELTKIYQAQPLKTSSASQGFFNFKAASPPSECIINSILLISLLKLTPAVSEKRLVILQNAAKLAAMLPKAKNLTTEALTNENELFKYLADSRQNNWAMKEALQWIMQQGWDKEFVAAAPSQFSLFSAITSIKSSHGQSYPYQQFFKTVEHKAEVGKFILYVNKLNQLVLRFEDEKTCRQFLGNIGQGQIPPEYRKGEQFKKNKSGLIPVEESKNSLIFCTYKAKGGELAIDLGDDVRKNNFIEHLQLKLSANHYLPISHEEQRNYLNGQLVSYSNNSTKIYFPKLLQPGSFLKVDGEKVLMGNENLNKLANSHFNELGEKPPALNNSKK